MGLASNLLARVRGAASPAATLYADSTDQKAVCNSRGELLVAQCLPPKAELVRLGNSYSMAIPTASAFTPVAAMPTTLSNLSLRNGEAAGGKTYVIDTIGVTAITSIAAASSFTLLAQQQSGAAALTNNTAVLIQSLSGKPNYGGKGTRALATTTAVADSWTIVGSQAASPSASIGAGAFAEVYGLFLIPPGSTFYVNCVFSTAAGTAIQTITWHEVQLDLG